MSEATWVEQRHVHAFHREPQGCLTTAVGGCAGGEFLGEGQPDGNSLGGTAHARLGILAFGTDTWWEVDAVEPADNVVDSVVQLVEAFAVPWLRERAAGD